MMEREGKAEKERKEESSDGERKEEKVMMVWI